MVTFVLPNWAGFAGIIAGGVIAFLIMIIVMKRKFTAARKRAEERERVAKWEYDNKLKRVLGTWLPVYNALLNVNGIRLREGILTEAVHRLNPTRSNENRIGAEGLNMLRSAFFQNNMGDTDFNRAWAELAPLLVKGVDFSMTSSY